MDKPDIAIIINSYNRLELLKECLNVLSVWVPNSIFYDRLVVIIYEAGSTDGSIEWLEAISLKLNFPVNIILPNSGDNTSFAAGINAAAKYAQTKYLSLRYLLFYETDNQITKSKPLEQAIWILDKRVKLAACGFTVRRHDGSPAGVGQPFPTLLNFALGSKLVHLFQLEAIKYKWETSVLGVEFSEVDVVYTSPLLVRIDAWKDSNGLDVNMFPFSECDVDWAKRLKKLGWKLGVIRSDAVIHDNKEKISEWSRSRAMQLHRAKLRYFKRYHPLTTLVVWPAVLSIRHFLEIIFARIAIRDVKRRKRIMEQSFELFRSSFKQYN